MNQFCRSPTGILQLYLLIRPCWAAEGVGAWGGALGKGWCVTDGGRVVGRWTIVVISSGRLGDKGTILEAVIDLG
jgi:hypothetical protein